MNRNGKRMKLEATRLTVAQQCEIIAKLSKPNAPSKQALGREYEVSEGTIQKVWDNRENILQKNPTCWEICWIWKCYWLQSFEALHNTVLNINNQLLWSDVQTEAGQMYDELRRWFETFNKKLTNWHLMSSIKKIMYSWQMTLHNVFKQENTNPNFYQKNYGLNRNAYLNGCILKREITAYEWKPQSISRWISNVCRLEMKS